MRKKDLFFKVKVSDYEKTTLYKYEHERSSLVLYRFDRPQQEDYSELSYIKDFKNPYIYCLFGIDENSVCSLYVGQSSARLKNSTTLQRIKEHKNEQWSSEWSTIFIMTRKNSNLDETSLNYLENRFFTIIKDNGFYKLWNTVTPSEGHPAEDKKADLDADIELWTYMFSIAGMRIDTLEKNKRFNKVANHIGLNQEKMEIKGKEYDLHFYSVQTRSGADAKICKIDSFYQTKSMKGAKDYYLLLKGSKLSDEYYLPDDKRVRDARKYIEKYCLDDEGRLKEDVPVTSRTTISSIIKGSHSSVTNDWEEIPGVLTEEQR